MSDDAQDVINEDAAPEAVEDTPVEAATDVVAAADADEVTEPVAEAPAEDAAEEAVAEPVATADAEGADAVAAADESEADAEPVAAADEPATGAAFGPVRVARVYVCERGHRTTTLWGEPDTCQARPYRNGAECAMKLYHITELPEQVQKALNPLKASKKASKKK